MKKNNKVNDKQEATTNKIKVKHIIKTIFVTILAMLGSIGFLVVSMTSVCPNIISKVFDFCGCDDANYLVHKRVYARERTNENLYNVIQLSINRKEYRDMESYIKIMLDGDNFTKFAKAVDGATMKALGEEYSIYADSYESYIRGELTLALYKNGKTLEAKMRAIDSVYSDTREMYVYVNCIADDESLTDLQKQNEISTLQNRYGVSEKLSNKLDELNDDYNLATDDYTKISVLEQRIKIAEIRMIIANYSSDEEEVKSIQNQIKEWNNEIISLSSNKI